MKNRISLRIPFQKVLIFFYVAFVSSLSFAQVIPTQVAKVSKLRDSRLSEVSGMVPYSYADGMFWVHNDSGDGAFVYLIDSLSHLKARYKLDGIHVRDVEDIAWLSIEGKPYILLADIGNNQRNRDTLSLYLFEEPVFDGNKEGNIRKAAVKTIRFSYEDKNRDAEALFVDPLDSQIYIVSKRDFRSQIFTLPLSCDDLSFYKLKPVLTLPFNFVTAADISRDGRYILVKNLTAIYFWERMPNTQLLQSIAGPARRMSYTIEPQGEAITFDKQNNRRFYTLSERPLGLDAYLYKYDF